MKKTIAILSTMLFLLFGLCPQNTSAAQSITTRTSYVYYNDGSYGIIEIIETADADRSVTNGSKTYTHKNSSGETLWSYTLKGTFTYTGSSATCTAVSDSYSIKNSSWHLDSHSCSKSGNTASGSITTKKKVLGITVDTVTKSLSISCSANGTLS